MLAWSHSTHPSLAGDGKGPVPLCISQQQAGHPAMLTTGEGAHMPPVKEGSAEGGQKTQLCRLCLTTQHTVKTPFPRLPTQSCNCSPGQHTGALQTFTH